MKARLLFFVVTGSLVAAATAQDARSSFDAFAPAAASTHWQPNPSLWRELTSGRSNAPVTLGESGLRASGPLLDAAATARRARGSKPGLGRTLLSVPVGIASLFVPQRMTKPPETGGSYFAWRQETASPWIHASAGAAVGPGLADNPITREPRNGWMNVTWRDERKPDLPPIPITP
ncbi:MAG: hypothetical protein HC814_07350 [Rhodobacteraceae bacterium]|nr:hypothetical protein [Paracoccaceae bacterium]